MARERTEWAKSMYDKGYLSLDQLDREQQKLKMAQDRLGQGCQKTGIQSWR